MGIENFNVIKLVDSLYGNEMQKVDDEVIIAKYNISVTKVVLPEQH